MCTAKWDKHRIIQNFGVNSIGYDGGYWLRTALPPRFYPAQLTR